MRGKNLINKVSAACALVIMLTPLQSMALGVSTGVTLSGSCNSDLPMAQESSMISSFDSIINQIVESGAALTAAQEAQSQITAQLVYQLRQTIKHAAVQSSNTKLEKTLAGNVSNVNLNSACAAVGSNGWVAGMNAGAVTAHNLGVSMNSVLAKNSSSQTSSYGSVSSLAAATMSSIDAHNILTGGNISNASKAVMVMTNPVPLPVLPAVAQTTPEGQDYKALTNIQQADVGLARRVLTNVAIMSAPTIPLKAYATQQINTIAADNPTLAKQMVSLLGANSTNISQNNFLYISNMERAGNPTWWTNIATSPNETTSLAAIAKTTALNMDESFQNLLLTEDSDAALAAKDSIEYNKNIQGQALSLRNKAIEEAVNN